MPYEMTVGDQILSYEMVTDKCNHMVDMLMSLVNQSTDADEKKEYINKSMACILMWETLLMDFDYEEFETDKDALYTKVASFNLGLPIKVKAAAGITMH